MAVLGSTAAVSGAREGSFGYPIADDIIKQIEVRGNIFAKDSKTPQDLTYIHSNAPWIMLRSGVDTPTGNIKVSEYSMDIPKLDSPQTGGLSNGGTIYLDREMGVGTVVDTSPNPVNTFETHTLTTIEEEHTSETAKNCVLVGGLGIVRGENKLNLAAGLGELAVNPAYRLSSVMGYRPIPGITGINVKSKDTWGAIMEAEISIQVWSREDLAVIDQLFFKPGMTALLEWGHSIWVDNNGKVHQADTSIPLSSEEFFTSHDFTELDELIQNRRAKFNGNYEACFGYITNFSYSFNDKGGYDCTVKMLSKSSVLEGLQIAKVGKGTEGKKSTRYHNLFTHWIVSKPYKRQIINFNQSGSSEESDEGGWGVKAGPSGFVVAPKSALSETSSSGSEGISEEDLNLLKSLNITLYRVPVKITDYSGWHNFWHNSTDEFTNLIYLSLRDLLKIVQTVNNVREDPKKEGLVKFDLNSQNEYVTFDEHFSLNPYVAAVPHKPGGEFGNAYVLTDNESTSTFRAPLETEGIEDLPVGEEKIMNICITANSFLGILDDLIDSETEDFSVFKVLNTLLADIQKAFGNVNDFGFHYNPDESLWSVVDRNNPKLWAADKGPGKICVSGLKTTLRKLSVNSAVSTAIANEMAIAAQAPSQQAQGALDSGMTEASPSVVNWNEGCVNRHKISNARSKAETNSKPEETIKDGNLNITFVREEYEDFLAKVEDFYSTVNDPDVGNSTENTDTGAYANQEYSNIYLQGEAIFKKIVNRDVNTGTTAGSLCMGVIPVKVELDMLGVSRFVVGTSFRITPGILLPKYDNWGYIVTGIENKVDSSGWTTHLRTQYFPVLNGKKVEQKSVSYTGSAKYKDWPIGEEIKDQPVSFWIARKNEKWSQTHKRKDSKAYYLGITPNMVDDAAYPIALNRGVFTHISHTDMLPSYRGLDCNRALVSSIKAIFAEIRQTAPNFKITGIGCTRKKDTVENGTSRHCWGIAIDINPDTNPWFDCEIKQSDAEPELGAKGPTCNPTGKGKLVNGKQWKSPPGGYDPNTCTWHYGHPVVQAFIHHGWGWGGAYGDVMHFSVDRGN